MSTAECPSSTNTRSVFHITGSCIAIIFPCTWTAIRPNVPSYEVASSKWRMIMRRVGMMLWTLIMPELMVCWAVLQMQDVKAISKAYLRDEGFMLKASEGDVQWTRVHSYFLAMGGFAIPEGNHAGKRWKSLRIAFPYVGEGMVPTATKIPFPSFAGSQSAHYHESALADRGKGDTLAKAGVIIQMFWFISQLLARAMEGLAVTELEIMTLAYAVICTILYSLWFEKPYDVQHPIMVAPEVARDDLRNESDAFKWRYLWNGHWLFMVLGRIIEDNHLDDFLTILWSPKATNVDIIIPSLASVLSAVIFGGIHLGGWNFEYPTWLERMLWISSSLCVTLAPLVWALCLAFFRNVDKRDGCIFTIAEWNLQIWTPILHYTYFISWLFLLVQSFALLRDLPCSAIEDIAWSSFIPHV